MRRAVRAAACRLVFCVCVGALAAGYPLWAVLFPAAGDWLERQATDWDDRAGREWSD